MRRLCICLFIFSLVFVGMAPERGFANAGPTYWQGYPSAEVLVIDENCPVEVTREKLLLDLNAEGKYSYTITGKVTASYEMVNPTDKDLSVQMAFPFVSSLADFRPEDITITANGSPLPYKLYIGDTVNGRADPSQDKTDADLLFENIINTVTNKPYQAQQFSEHEQGKLYTLIVQPTTEQRINIALDLTWDHDKTKVLVDGFNRYKRDKEKVRIASWCYEPTMLQLLVLGDAIDFHITAYTDGELKQETDLFDCQISSKKTDLKSYLIDYARGYKMSPNQLETPDRQIVGISDEQLYNMYAATLDKILTDNWGFCSSGDLVAQNRSDRVMTLVYTVDFPADSHKNMTVHYKTIGTMDRRKTATPVYTFNYILNPAQSWSNFQNLTIEVLTPEESPYVVYSNIELAKENQRHYRARLNTLPDGDFIFSIYAREKITAWDKLYGAWHFTFGYFTPLVTGGIGIMMLAVATTILLKRKKAG
ncbi:MAG: hypothetical protein ACOYEO_07125 [bacterium]